MTEINLLPWREQARQAKKIRFALSIVAAIILAVILVILLHIYFNMLIAHEQRRNDFLQTRIDDEQASVRSLNKKKKEMLTVDEELHFITNLRETSFQAVRILDELARVVPPGVTFNKIVREGSNITVLGKARSNMEVTQLMTNMRESPIFTQPELTEISAKESSAGEERYFQLTATQELVTTTPTGAVSSQEVQATKPTAPPGGTSDGH